jgi:two-component system, NtrC family, response regulator AtoC
MPRSDELATDIVNDAPAHAPTGRRRRVVLFWDGGSRSAEVVERGTMTIGRAPSCAVAVEHGSVSRVHAALHVGSTLILEDLGSANGTWVEGRRLAASERAPVPTGAVARIGLVNVVVIDDGAPPSIAAESAMTRLEQLVELVASSEISVIIQGETGAGKEVLAARIHGLSPRAAGPFVRLNCAALPDALLESELFGHERGAFTGAAQAKIGLIEAANGGTLFLDEIGEMGAATQAKLLRAIEAREVTPLGSVKPRRIDVRFLAATHRDLGAMVEEGSFRRDLFFRLDGISLTIPPLRERRDEIEVLARSFADEASRRAGQAPAPISERAMAALRAHLWPGNIRELKNVVERAVLLARGGEIGLAHVDLGGASMRPPPPSASAAAAAAAAAAAPGSARPSALPAELATVERALICEALEKSGGNQKEAAKILGISRRTLLYRLDMYDLPRPRKRT